MKIRNGDISESDLAAAKEHLIGGIYLASESADNRMMRIAKNEFVFEKYVSHEELVSNLEQVTVDEVVGIAQDIFRSGRVSLATLGPMREEHLDKGCLQFN